MKACVMVIICTKVSMKLYQGTSMYFGLFSNSKQITWST